MTDMFTGAAAFSAENYIALLPGWRGASEVFSSGVSTPSFGAPPVAKSCEVAGNAQLQAAINAFETDHDWTISGDLYGDARDLRVTLRAADEDNNNNIEAQAAAICLAPDDATEVHFTISGLSGTQVQYTLTDFSAALSGDQPEPITATLGDEALAVSLAPNVPASQARAQNVSLNITRIMGQGGCAFDLSGIEANHLRASVRVRPEPDVRGILLHADELAVCPSGTDVTFRVGRALGGESPTNFRAGDVLRYRFGDENAPVETHTVPNASLGFSSSLSIEKEGLNTAGNFTLVSLSRTTADEACTADIPNTQVAVTQTPAPENISVSRVGSDNKVCAGSNSDL